MRGIAAVPRSKDAIFVDHPEPKSAPAGQVLCRTIELGICGTDREILESEEPLIPPGAEHLVLGHECLARVEDVGAGVTDLAVGDLVIPLVRRSEDVSIARVDMIPFGSYTERGIVWEHGFSLPWWHDEPRHLLRFEAGQADWAVLTEPMAVSEKGVNEAMALQRGRLGAEAWTSQPPRVLVTGLGPIGFTAAIACVARGWPTTVYGRDLPDSFRAGLVQRLGAHYLAASASRFDTLDAERDGYDLILECTGSDEVTLAAALALATCGVMVWLGTSRVPRPKPHNVERLMRDGVLRNHLHVGCVNAARRDFEDAIRDLEATHRRVPQALADMVTARVPPAESLWHYQNRQPQGIKTVLVYD